MKKSEIKIKSDRGHELNANRIEFTKRLQKLLKDDMRVLGNASLVETMALIRALKETTEEILALVNQDETKAM